MGLLDSLPKVGRKKLTVREDDAGQASEFLQRFSEQVESVTPDVVAAVAKEERAAAKSEGQRGRRKRPQVRTENLGARVEPKVMYVLRELAKRHGGRTMADGLHIAVDMLMQLENIPPMEQGND
jgi:hypothetical protein